MYSNKLMLIALYDKLNRISKLSYDEVQHIRNVLADISSNINKESWTGSLILDLIRQIQDVVDSPLMKNEVARRLRDIIELI